MININSLNKQTMLKVSSQTQCYHRGAGNMFSTQNLNTTLKGLVSIFFIKK